MELETSSSVIVMEERELFTSGRSREGVGGGFTEDQMDVKCWLKSSAISAGSVMVRLLWVRHGRMWEDFLCDLTKAQNSLGSLEARAATSQAYLS